MLDIQTFAKILYIRESTIVTNNKVLFTKQINNKNAKSKRDSNNASRLLLQVEILIKISKVSLSQIYEIIIDILLFYSYFFSRTLICNKIYYDVN